VAIEDDRPEIKRLAVLALKALGDLSLLMPVLSRDGDPVARRNAMAAIRAYLALGPDSVSRVRNQLDEEFGEPGGARAVYADQLSPEAVARATFPKMVGLLSEQGRSASASWLSIP
jgi:hypothetical protein